jgi:hypothetical protein
MHARHTTTVNDSEAPNPDEAHATTDAPEATLPDPATTTPRTEAGVTTTSTTAQMQAKAPDREEALARLRRSSAPSPEESQIEGIEQHRAYLSKDGPRSPFDATRPYCNTSLEDGNLDPSVGWQGPETDLSRILRRHVRTSNDLRFSTNDRSDPKEDSDSEM